MADHNEPIAIVEVAFAALERGEWATYIGLLDPESLEEFKQSEIANLAKYAKWEHSSDPRAQEILLGLFGATSAEELAARPASELLERCLRGRQPHVEHPEYEPLRRSRTIVGAVAEDPTHTHVVYRSVMRARIGPTRLHRTRLEVATVVRTASGWRLRLNDDVTGGDLGTMIETAGGARPPAG